MSKATVLLVVCCCIVIACAMGGSASHQGEPSDARAADGATAHDASPGDGATPHDAKSLDAFVPQDAAHVYGHEGDLCQVNQDCDANMGLCCFFFQCSIGTGLGSNICVPPN